MRSAHLPRHFGVGDVYWRGGAAEKEFTFIRAPGLPDRLAAWPAGQPLVVTELGFGAGLNTCLLAQLAAQHPHVPVRMFSYELDMLPTARIGSMLAAAGLNPTAPHVQQLLAAWPTVRSGWNQLACGPLEVNLFVGDVRVGLPTQTTPSHVWWLDGFAPAKNPAMWGPEVAAALLRLSQPGSVVATYSVAGSVRQLLTNAGYRPHKRPGYPPKREMLLAEFEGLQTPAPVVRNLKKQTERD